MIINKKIMVGTMLAMLLNFVSCANDEANVDEVIQPEGGETLNEDEVIEASEEAAEQAADQMEDEYVEQDTLKDSSEYYGSNDNVEDTGSITEESSMIDTEPTYADESATSYSSDSDSMMADNEDEDVDFNDSASDAEPMKMAPVSTPKAAPVKTASKPKSTPAYSAPARSGEYIVQPGDTLSIIAGKLYGNSGRWEELASQNNMTGSQTIFPGDLIRYDSGDQTASNYMSKMEKSMQSVTVEKGDTLSSISQKLFNTGGGWKYLFQVNAQKISNPNMIYVGQVLHYANPTPTSMTH